MAVTVYANPYNYASNDSLVTDYKNFHNNVPGDVDAEYLKLIEKYKDESWYDRLLENPYLASKSAAFSPSFWQSASEALFGDTSARDNYYSELAQNSSKWLSETLSQYHQQDYNSAQEQAARERAAGLNPDINGQVTPGAASENDQMQLPSVSMDGATGLSSQEFVDASISFIGGILSFAQGIQGLSINEAGLVAQDLENNSTAMNFALNSIAGLSTFSDKDEDFLDNMQGLSEEERAALIAPARAKADRHHLKGFNRHTRKLITGWYDSFEKGEPMAVEAARAKLREIITSSNTNAATFASQPNFDKKFYKMTEKLADTLSKAEYNAHMLMLWRQNKENGYYTKYFHGQTMRQAVQNMQEETYKEVSDAIELGRGKWWYFPAKMGLPRLRQAIDGLFNIAPSVAGQAVLKKMPNLSNVSSNSVSHSFVHQM